MFMRACWQIVGSGDVLPITVSLSQRVQNRRDLYEPGREFVMHIKRGVGAQNQTQHMLYSAHLLRKLVD